MIYTVFGGKSGNNFTSITCGMNIILPSCIIIQLILYLFLSRTRISNYHHFFKITIKNNYLLFFTVNLHKKIICFLYITDNQYVLISLFTHVLHILIYIYSVFLLNFWGEKLSKIMSFTSK